MRGTGGGGRGTPGRWMIQGDYLESPLIDLGSLDALPHLS